MPTYDYRCSACKHEFEQFQSMKDKPLRTCPACKKAKLERLIGTGGAIIFKGSGFYQTDYRSEGYKKAADADKPAENKPADSKADSKPETKAESKSDSAASSKSAASAKSDAKPAKNAKSKPDGKKN
ncbi:MAG TPA: zinc ribbon domain-containing protein [Phycisphaerales bacterium]|nr:zinc ribbon domain-containing protein [Phycisphaerales bacterium]